MASTSIPHRWTYNAFISFRGEDLRKGFMDHLHKDFRQKGIYAFRDDNELPRGEVIAPQLYKAIEESKFLIVIFSKDYASSSWCLKELVKILECNQIGMPKYHVLTIFYDVKPHVVRKQSESYAQAFDKHEIENTTKVAEWKEALSAAADLSGWDLQDMANGYESKFIDSISKEILEKLCEGPLHVGENLVGVDARIEDMRLLRFVGSSKVHMIGICGIGGAGKTTLAKAIYNLLYIHFDEHSFMDDVQGATKQHGLTHVVVQLIDDIMKTSGIKIHSIGQGIKVMKERMSSRKILLVLDGVDHHEQLEALVGSSNWFSPGSLIIFTSQDKQLLRSHNVEPIYDIEFLHEVEALKLFCWYAFRKEHPTEDFQKLAYRMVQLVQGHPLALNFLGRALYKKPMPVWISELEKLQTNPDAKIHQVLRSSFDGLDFKQQRILLDIASALVGESKDLAASVLDSCNFHSHTNMEALADKSLITISSSMSLQMHELVQIIAREIVNEESKWPGDRSRLWIQPEVCDVLSKNKVTEAVEVLVLLLDKSSQRVHVDGKAFARMKRLRILKICDLVMEDFGQIFELKQPKDSKINFSGSSLEYLSNELRLLYWHGYPFKFLPSSFYPENIVALDMSYSHIKNLWTTPKLFKQLKVMKLRHCRNLTRTPDFTQIPNLEELILEGCVNLVELHPSFGMLKRLVVLNMRNCTRLKSIPSKLELDSLEVLILSGCIELEKLPDALGSVNTLTELYVDQTAIKEFPSFVFTLRNLQAVSIGQHEALQPTSWTSFFRPSYLLSKLQRPQSLVLSWPTSIFWSSSLPRLQHPQSLESSLSTSMSLPSCLPSKRQHPKSLALSSLTSASPPIKKQHPNKTLLSSSSVTSVSPPLCLPSKMKHSKKNVFLSSSVTSVSQPSSSSSVYEQVPSVLLTSLASICLLTGLDVSNCCISEVSPHIVGGLSFLEDLNLSRNPILSLPGSLSGLLRLKSLAVDGCKNLVVLPELPPGIVFFSALHCISLWELKKLPIIPLNVPQFLYFAGSPKLAENPISIMNLQSLMCILLPQGLNYLCNGIDVWFHGNRIPRWFTSRNKGNRVKVEFPPGWCYNKFRGYVTWVVFTRKKYYSSNGNANYSPPGYFVTNFDRACLNETCLLPCEDSTLEGDDANGIDQTWLHYSERKPSWMVAKNFVTFSFRDSSSYEVKECGVKLVCDEDTKEEMVLNMILGRPTPRQHNSAFNCSY